MKSYVRPNAFVSGKCAFAIILLTVTAGISSAQTNTFPSSGNVGIGTTSPGEKLNVLGNGLFGNVTNHTLLYSTYDSQANMILELGYGTSHSAITPFPAFVLSNHTTSTNNSEGLIGQIVFANRSIADNSDKRLGVITSWVDGASNSGTLQFYTANAGTVSERLRISSSGNVGIGTTSPSTKLHVVGDITVTGNIAAKYQDVAEWVPATRALPPGTVVTLNRTQSNQVEASSKAYDIRVAGVISAQPGITLGEKGANKVLVATTGRVRIKVDATHVPIEIGDLLVTSEKEGIAMKSVPVDIGGVQIHRPGTLIGKALEPLAKGQGEILVLLSLQ